MTALRAPRPVVSVSMRRSSCDEHGPSFNLAEVPGCVTVADGFL